MNDILAALDQHPVTHHTVNAAVIAVPAAIVAGHGPEVWAYITGFLGAVYYVLIIARELRQWFKPRDKDGPPRTGS